MSSLMYHDLAAWWPLLSAPAEYVDEATTYRRLLLEAGPVETVLELGSGGGNNASHFKQHFSMTLVDRSEDMLEVSRALNPECEHLQGDMRTLRLDRVFDAVFIHDAIGYMTTRDDLARAIRTAFVHTRPGGVALLCPDFVRETFQPYTHHGGHDGPDRGLRYLQWTHAAQDDATCITDFAFLLRHPDGSVTVESDRHRTGLFPRAVWLDSLTEAGFRDAQAITIEHTEAELETTEVFRATRL